MYIYTLVWCSAFIYVIAFFFCALCASLSHPFYAFTLTADSSWMRRIPIVIDCMHKARNSGAHIYSQTHKHTFAHMCVACLQQQIQLTNINEHPLIAPTLDTSNFSAACPPNGLPPQFCHSSNCQATPIWQHPTAYHRRNAHFYVNA